MPPRPLPHSRSQVNKAGRTLRRAMRGELIAADDLDRAITVLEDFRAAHQVSLTTATMGLRSMVDSEGCHEPQISQRLKRRETILDKLTRQPTLPLASMQDIAGCRAVVETTDELQRVQRRLQHRRPAVNVYDYITQPRPSGYRGTHVVVDYHDRKIEVQLRTITMHEWAIAVERFGGRIGEDLKSSEGPPEVLEWLAEVSRAMATEEMGHTVDQETLDEINRLRARAAPKLGGGPTR